jgi:hypothetical protein
MDPKRTDATSTGPELVDSDAKTFSEVVRTAAPTHTRLRKMKYTTAGTLRRSNEKWAR